MERDIKPTYDELESYIERLDRQRTDAQATIAALQDTIMQMGGQAAVLAKDAMAAKEQVAALQAQITAARERCRCYTNWWDGKCPESPSIDQLEQQLTQRTAELKAAKAQHKDLVLRNRTLRDRPDLPVERTSFHDEVVKLQAELERVRGELAETKEEVTCLDEQVSALNQGCLEYERLIKALPKVEGEISERFCTGSYYSSPHDYRSHVTFETALVALLKHRQGMEG